jgi:hypothetical protein
MDILAFQAIRIGRNRLEIARRPGLHDPVCQHLHPERAAEVSRPAGHFLGGPERDLGLVAGPSSAVYFGTSLSVGSQHVERGRVRHRRLAVPARDLDIDAPKSPLARIGTDPTECSGQDEGLPGSQLDALAGHRPLDMRQQLCEAANAFGGQGVEPVGPTPPRQVA